MSSKRCGVLRMSEDIVEKQRRFYLEKFKKYQDAPQSLSYNDRVTQYVRFEMLNRLFRHENEEHSFSVHEIGSGLAHYYEFLKERTRYQVEYSGSEVVEEFIRHTAGKHPSLKIFHRDITQDIPEDRYDYLVLSGTFNPIQDVEKDRWNSFVERMILNMFRMAKKGIGMNFLTGYSDFTEKALYYCDPRDLYDFIQRNLSRYFIIDNSYPLYEFTVLVYRSEFIQEVYQEKEFHKYFKR
jgi:hypothetical protein